MDSLNEALDHLRTLLPQLPSDPKMTKIETLRMAQGYIHVSLIYSKFFDLSYFDPPFADALLDAGR